MRRFSTPLAAFLLAALLLACSNTTSGGLLNDQNTDTSTSNNTTPDTDTTDVPPDLPSVCEGSDALDALGDWPRETFDALTEGIDQPPTPVELAEETNGTLDLGLRPALLPVGAGPSGVHVAAARMGEGRVVAFSGQDFLSSYERSTLLGESGVQRLLRNAVAWAGGEADAPRVLADNEAVAGVLRSGGGLEVAVTPTIEVLGLREIRDWSAGALEGANVLVVQVNEWGTLHVSDDHVGAIKDFVRGGGGLLIAGSALHWSWWLSDQGPAFPGDAILADAGIAWSARAVHDLREVRFAFDVGANPVAAWCAYVDGETLPEGGEARLAPLFVDAATAGRLGEVDRALARLIAETPALPAASSDPRARLSAEVAVTLSAHRWSAPHPWSATFPGEVAADAPRDKVTVDIDTAWTDAQPLGLYAPPGEIVTISADAGGTAGLSVRVGDLHDDLGSIDGIDQWRRAPRMYASTPLGTERVEVGTGLGGALYVVVPGDFPTRTVTLEVEGAVPMGLYRRGGGDGEAFAARVAMGAPQAILSSPGKIQMVVPSAEAAAVPDPEAVLAFWDRFHESHAELGQEPTPRTYASHWLFDPHVGWGYANATRERIAYPDLVVGQALRTQTGGEDWWLFGHELGHQFQTGDWSGGDITEVAVNLFTMYTLNSYIFGGGDLETRGHMDNAIDHVALDGASWERADLFGKLELYRQLVFVFGWEAFKDVFASYYSLQTPRETFGGFMDGFALRMSHVTRRDLTPFLDRWGYPMSAEARERILSWGLEPWLPPGW